MSLTRLTSYFATFLVGFFLLAGCGGGSNPTAPPDGWKTGDMRWWKSGVDTSQVFPDLDSLTTMGVLDKRMSMMERGQVTQKRFNAAIKRSLIKLYRNNPTIVDSLFEKYAVPKLKKVDLSGDIVGKKGQLKSKILNKNQKKAYEAINKYFREPQRQKSPDKIIWPDSLRSKEHAGIVKLQVHLTVEGKGDNAVARADAIEVLSGTHPTLNRIAMKAATKARWDPAYLLKDDNWTPVESWVRFDIPFQMR
ncbi:MAG: energy transducer TonB [Salinibacter sp.]